MNKYYKKWFSSVAAVIDLYKSRDLFQPITAAPDENKSKSNCTKKTITKKLQNWQQITENVSKKPDRFWFYFINRKKCKQSFSIKFDKKLVMYLSVLIMKIVYRPLWPVTSFTNIFVHSAVRYMSVRLPATLKQGSLTTGVCLHVLACHWPIQKVISTRIFLILATLFFWPPYKCKISPQRTENK